MTLEQLIKDEAKLARKQGKAEGMNLLNELYTRLIQDNRIEEMQAATTDEELRKKLFEEYGIEV